jgi:DNA-binding NtrC family response regulator
MMTSPLPKPRVLLIDDEADFRADLVQLLQDRYDFFEAATAAEGLAAIETSEPQVVLLDLDLRESASGLDVLRALAKSGDYPPVIMLTGTHSVSKIVETIKAGATNYVCKPPDVDQLVNAITLALAESDRKRRIEALEAEIRRTHGDFIAVDPASRNVLSEIELVAPTDTTVLITGECGTGKEMVARRIHALSRRSEQPFVAVNCGGIPKDLMESELFGHEKGAFTGAERRRRGRFELADGGTIFLDEIGDSPPGFQVKLLRVLENREYTRVGGERTLITNARVVAATCRNLEEAIDRGDFRSELFYRLNVFRIHLLPLNRRRADIEPLANRFLADAARQFGKSIGGFSAGAHDDLIEREWRGNVRELKNTIERAALRCTGDTVEVGDLLHGTGGPQFGLLYDEAKNRVLKTFKKQYLVYQLKLAQGNVGLAAERSGVPRQSFYRMLNESGVNPEAYRAR